MKTCRVICAPLPAYGKSVAASAGRTGPPLCRNIRPSSGWSHRRHGKHALAWRAAGRQQPARRGFHPHTPLFGPGLPASRVHATLENPSCQFGCAQVWANLVFVAAVCDRRNGAHRAPLQRIGPLPVLIMGLPSGCNMRQRVVAFESRQQGDSHERKLRAVLMKSKRVGTPR